MMIRPAVSRFALAVFVLACLPVSGFSQTPNWPSESPPRPLPARDVKFPAFEVKTFANGLRVVVVPHHEQPAVSMRLLVRAGSAQDPIGKAGVASMVASLLDQGTTTKSAEQIADAIDTIGGSLGTGAGSDLSYVNIFVMKDSLDLALDMLSDMLRNPAIAPEEIERQRQQVLAGLRVSYEDPGYIAGVVFARLVFGFHPYGLPENGTPESVARITRDDLVRFHKTYFTPNNCLMAVVGDVTTEEAFSGVERALGSWPNRDVALATLPEAPAPTRRVVIIDKPGSVQTEIRVGHLGVPRKHPDHMALDLATRILGGEGSNRLHRVLRTERGLTYGAQAEMETLKESGDFVAETNTRSDATGEVLSLILDEFRRIQSERVGERELADAKAYLAGSFPLTIETPDAIALQILNALFYELDIGELQTFRERVNAVAVGDVERVVRTHLKPDRLSIVLVGDAAGFVDRLHDAGFAKYERVSLQDLDLSAADFRRETK